MQNGTVPDKYKHLWSLLKQHGSIALSVDVKHHDTLIKGIVNVKHREGLYYKAADLPLPGKLKITRSEKTLLLELIPDLRQTTVGEL
mgnify:CR=1 FL=1